MQISRDKFIGRGMVISLLAFCLAATVDDAIYIMYYRPTIYGELFSGKGHFTAYFDYVVSPVGLWTSVPMLVSLLSFGVFYIASACMDR